MTTIQQQDTTLHPADHRNAARIAARLTRGDITTGDIAGLRRLNERRPTESAFWRMCTQLEIDEASPDIIESWAVVSRIIASGTKVGETQTIGPHDGYAPLGKVLAEAGYSQNRLKTLLHANEAALPPIVERMAGLLHSKGQKFNCNDVARLVLTRHRTQDQRDADRTRIARDYYWQVHQQERQRE